MKNVCIAILVLMAAPAWSQNITTSTLQWDTEKTFKVNTGEVVLESNQLISTQQTKVDWNDASGTLKYSFDVAEVTGSWSSVASNGEIIYEVTSGTVKGNIYFNRNGDTVVIRIFILVDGEPEIYELTVNSTRTL